MTRPLAGIRIVDLSTVLSGPLATALLADQGASVIKIEPLEGDTVRRVGPAKGDQSAMYVAANRGKRSIALDLKSPAARPVIEALLDQADALVENFRPGVMDRLGLADATLAARWPALVRLSITGFGPDGPRSGDKAYDSVIQAVAGVCATHPNRETGEPDLLPGALCDKLTALTAAQALTAALLARSRDGRGRRVEVSMLDATLAFQWPDTMYNEAFLEDPPPRMPEFGVTYRPWRTADGHVATMAPQPAEFAGLCEILGRADLIADPRFATPASRARNGKALVAELAPQMATRRTADLVQAARAHGVPLGAVQDRGQVLADPQVAHAATLVEVQHPATGRVRLARSAARFDGQLQTPTGPGAALGEHGRELLRALGLSDEAVDALVAQGVLKLPGRPLA